MSTERPKKMLWKQCREVLTDLAPLKALRGLVLVVHPFPATMTAVAGTTFYLLAADEAQGLNWVMIFGSILLLAASIGSMNDYCDIELDRRTKPGRPIVRGDIQPRTALVVSCVAATTGALLSALFGWKTLVIALVVLASGMAYNFWAKGTIYSWVPYAVSVPALPVWSFLAANKFTPVVLVSFPLGALISLALNLANTLPDLPGDVRYGLKGLTHRLGLRRSIIVIWCSFGAALGLLALTPVVLGNDPRGLFPGIILGTVLLLVMITDYAVSRSKSLRRGWYFSAILAVLIGGAWVASLSSG